MVSCDNKTTDNGTLLMLGSPRSALIGFSPDSIVYPVCALHLPALSSSCTHSNFLAICLGLIRKRRRFALHLPAVFSHCSGVFAPRQHIWRGARARVLISSRAVGLMFWLNRTSPRRYPRWSPPLASPLTPTPQGNVHARSDHDGPAEGRVKRWLRSC